MEDPDDGDGGAGVSWRTVSVALALVVVAAAATLFAVSEGAFNGLKETNEPSELDRSRVETAIHDRVNDRRRANGLDPLEMDEELRAMGRNYSRRMVREGFFAHESPSGDTWDERYDAAGYDCEIVVNETRGFVRQERVLRGGENLGKVRWSGTSLSAEDVAERVVTDWMSSQRHRKNLLRGPWRREGIGVYGNDSVLAVSQYFC